jgi:hypothetical protein
MLQAWLQALISSRFCSIGRSERDCWPALPGLSAPGTFRRMRCVMAHTLFGRV